MSRNRVLLALAIAVSTGILLTTVGSWPSMMAAPSPAPSIVGSWVVFPGGGALTVGRPSLYTFTSDGTIRWSGPLGSMNGGAGAWVSTGDRAVTGTFIHTWHNAGGDFTQTTKVRLKITLNATYDAFTGSGKADFFDAHGMPARSLNVTVQGTRIKVESP